MKLESSRFGVVELPPERLFHFPEGIAGLPGKSWALYSPPGATGYAWLLSAEDPSKGIVLAQAQRLLPSYAPRHRPEEADAVQAGPREYWIVVRQAPTPGQLLLNLFAPIVLNPETRLGVQVPLVGSEFGLAELFPSEGSV